MLERHLSIFKVVKVYNMLFFLIILIFCSIKIVHRFTCTSCLQFVIFSLSVNHVIYSKKKNQHLLAICYLLDMNYGEKNEAVVIAGKLHFYITAPGRCSAQEGYEALLMLVYVSNILSGRGCKVTHLCILKSVYLHFMQLTHAIFKRAGWLRLLNDLIIKF